MRSSAARGVLLDDRGIVSVDANSPSRGKHGRQFATASRSTESFLLEPSLSSYSSSFSSTFSSSSANPPGCAALMSSVCCSMLSKSPTTSNTLVSFEDILWCEEESSPTNIFLAHAETGHRVLNITYLDSANSKPSVQHLVVAIPIETPNSTAAEVLERAYAKSIVRPRLLVLINPRGGRGTAMQLIRNDIEPVLTAANAQVTYIQTQYTKHAVDIARDLDVDQYDAIVCCSGDGVPHEVLNGFYLRPDKGVSAFNKIAISQLPCGSGNALSLSTHGTANPALATLRLLKASRFKMDVMAITQGLGTDSTTSLSFLSQCFGIIADSDIGTENLRWMGPIRFDLGVAKYICEGRSYPCDVYVKHVAKDAEDISALFQDTVRANASLQNLYDDGAHTEIRESDLTVKHPDLSQDVPHDWEKLPSEITSNLLIFYTGKMPVISKDVFFFPAALPNDGAMDLVVMDNRGSLFKTAKLLLSVDSGKHINEKSVYFSKILAYRLVPRLTDNNVHYISVDGENYQVRTTQAEIMRGIVTVLLTNNQYVKTGFQ